MSSLAVHMLRKPAISNDTEDNKGTKMEDKSSDADSFEDAMNDPPSTHFDIFDILSDQSGQTNDTVGASNQTSEMSNEETETTFEDGAAADEKTSEDEKSTSSTQDSSDNSSSTIAKSNLPFFLKSLEVIK